MSIESPATRECPENHVPDLWFPDGNVIIRVGERVCCVYKGFLATQSPVLSDMFSFPQPQSADTYLGLPTVTFPDAESDVEHWLKALLVPGYFKNHPEEVDGTRLLAVLRLSHKYDVQYFRQCALRYLGHDYATDLDAHLQEPWYNTEKSAIILPAKLRFFSDLYNAATEAGALWLIPSIVYTLHVHSIFSTNKTDQIAGRITPSGLAHMWKFAILAGTELRGGFLIPPAAPAYVCPRPQACAPHACAVFCASSNAYTADPLGFFTPRRLDVKTAASDQLKAHACTSCRDMIRKQHREMCEAFWETFPEKLGLGTWAELRAMKASDLGQSAEG